MNVIPFIPCNSYVTKCHKTEPKSRRQIFTNQDSRELYIYIWSEIFRSPSEAKYGCQGGPKLRLFQSPTRSFMFMCYVKTALGD